MTDDILKSPLVRDQKTFEKRLAAAVMLHAQEDFMMFEDAVVPQGRKARERSNERRKAIESATSFYDYSNGKRGNSMLRFWHLVMFPTVNNPGVSLEQLKRLTEKKRRLYEAELNRRVGGALSGFPAWVAVEAYRRVVEAGWFAYYAVYSGEMPSRSMSGEKREAWQAAFRVFVPKETVEKEANDIMFEFNNGLTAAA